MRGHGDRRGTKGPAAEGENRGGPRGRVPQRAGGRRASGSHTPRIISGLCESGFGRAARVEIRSQWQQIRDELVKEVNVIFRGKKTVDRGKRGLRGKGGFLIYSFLLCH